MLTASAMGHFEDEIAKAVVLALFVPLIISSGGNTGSQAATLIIRAMALQEVGLKDWWYVMKKEIITGTLLGTILGAIGFLRIGIWHSIGLIDYGPHWLFVGFSIGVSLIGSSLGYDFGVYGSIYFEEDEFRPCDFFGAICSYFSRCYGAYYLFFCGRAIISRKITIIFLLVM